MSLHALPDNTLQRPNVALPPPLNNGINHVNATALTRSLATTSRNVSINVHPVGLLVHPNVVLLDHPKGMDSVL